ncbi:hypothetical protein G5V59_14945 [Nocardioides sp. W3-2-3]|uniref:hypothetical protein n=1 Tax=Nocardioides convexus TaxID=2712224 RepID=UPI0024183952|nr:hypothetical protein [Nocardioides convexus]NHA00803.1 hypothetical protein [Nocardioides convexus]
MRTVLLASLRTHTRRYGAALLAIVVGVVLVLVTAALSSSVRDGLTSGLADPYDGADAVLDRPSAADAAKPDRRRARGRRRRLAGRLDHAAGSPATAGS